MEKMNLGDMFFNQLSAEKTEKIRRMSLEEYDNWQIQIANSIKGNLTGYDCPDCKNRGYFTKKDSCGNIYQSECRCMITRRAEMRLARSGLATLSEKTFDAFSAVEQWQKSLKTVAVKYAENPQKWFFIGGQSGGGKTHLCTAICLNLIKKGRDVHYVLWRDLLHELESLRYKYDEYSTKMDKLKNYDVLYIDDFLKSIDDGHRLQGLNFAYEVINSRAINKKLTIISTELLDSEILNADTALHGRIAENAGDFILNIRRDSNKNHRLK